MKKKNKNKRAFLSKCPVSGGACLNPLCVFGCIERKIRKG